MWQTKSFRFLVWRSIKISALHLPSASKSFFRFSSPRSPIGVHEIITERSSIRIFATVNISKVKSSHFQILFTFLINGFKTNFLIWFQTFAMFCMLYVFFWLKLFLSQTLSHIDTYTILKFSHYSTSCLLRWNR
jgi:hypothetical protein